MPLEKWTCTACEKEFLAGEWNCPVGVNHVVEVKEYFILDAPADHNDRIHSRNLICNVIPEKQETRGNDIIRVPGVHAEFVRGKFATSDPQMQMHLNKRKNILSGPAGEKAWEGNYLTDKEKSFRKEMDLQAQITRLQADKNELLAKVQAGARKSA